MEFRWLIGAAFAAAALAASACATGPDPNPAAPAQTLTCATARPFAPGLSHRRIESGGRLRDYDVYVPRSYDGHGAAPVVFDLQASGITPAVEMAITGMDRAAERRGFIVVAPAAVTPFPQGGHTWNIPHDPSGVDDVAFIADVLADVRETFCIDEQRVYATGFSGGARLASELACRMPERFAAISAVGGLRHAGDCAAGSASILAIHSIDDPINHYEHAPSRSPPWWTHGVEEALTRWAHTLACAAPREEARLTPAVERITLAGCRNGARVVLYRMRGSGHTWPGSSFAFPPHLGETENEIDATRLSVEFFLGPGEG